ncbi:hypothetical protein Pgy4_40642, partial [Pseudomonas savastanoi pv. glycinea str. race 4]
MITEVILNLGQFLSNYGLAVLAGLIALIWGMAIRMR